MAPGKFIKENFVLVMGLTLPVLLVITFFLATVLPKSWTTPPQYELLFSTLYYNYQSPALYNVDFVVRNRALKARISKNKPATTNYYPLRKLMIYDGKNQSVSEVAYDLSKIGDVPDGSEIVINELKNAKIDTSTKAPDGYIFENIGHGYGGIAPDLFWGGGYRAVSRVNKGAVSFKIPESQNGYGYNDIQFIGWIISK